MTKEELQQKISSIIDADSGYGFEAYACLQNSRCKNFIIEDKDNESFKDAIADKIASCISDNFLSDIDLKQVEDIHDNTNSFFEIIQNDNYSPFYFIKTPEEGSFSDKEKPSLTGFAFKFNINDTYFWAYQQVYPVTIPQSKKGTFLYAINNDIYKEFPKELIKIDYRVDLIIIGSSIITKNINLLQNKFGFDTFIRNESQKTIQLINGMSIIEDMSKIVEFDENEKLTNAKKLMKIKNSPVLQMNSNVLIERLRTHSRYKDKLKFNEDNTQIRIKTKKDVKELLKILNDDYLKSELTEQNYDSPSKTIDNNT